MCVCTCNILFPYLCRYRWYAYGTSIYAYVSYRKKCQAPSLCIAAEARASSPTIERATHNPQLHTTMDSPLSQNDVSATLDGVGEESAAAKEKRKASRKKRLPTSRHEEEEDDDAVKLKKPKKRKVREEEIPGLFWLHTMVYALTIALFLVMSLPLPFPLSGQGERNRRPCLQETAKAESREVTPGGRIISSPNGS